MPMLMVVHLNHLACQISTLDLHMSFVWMLLGSSLGKKGPSVHHETNSDVCVWPALNTHTYIYIHMFPTFPTTEHCMYIYIFIYLFI